jgi:dTMP kinase
MSGLFITFEGCEGCGKSTQADRLVERLRSMQVRVLNTREPGGTRTGDLIREILQHDRCKEALFSEAETLLFAGSRAQLVRQVIVPALEAGECVICDRFTDSTIAYQGYGRGLDIDSIVSMNSFASGSAVPDVTFLLDVDLRVGFERLHKRLLATGAVQDRIESENLAFHERVRKGYQDLARRYHERFRIIDASRDEETIAADIWNIVSGCMARLNIRSDAGTGNQV